jgi:hypothetical protein
MLLFMMLPGASDCPFLLNLMRMGLVNRAPTAVKELLNASTHLRRKIYQIAHKFHISTCIMVILCV